MPDANRSLDILIDAYISAPGVLREAVSAVPPEHHRTRTEDVEGVGLWSVREIVAHCADADIALNHRLRRTLAEDRPRLSNWDEAALVASLNYADEDVSVGLELIDLLHRRMLPLLRSLSDSALDRVALHEINGPLSARDILSYAGFHLRHHAGFVRRKKEAMGW